MSPGHEPSAALIDYHRRVAEGGVGMTTVAYAAVERSGLSFPHQLWMRPAIVPDLAALTGAVHAAGAKASIQLGHTGDMAKAGVAGGRPISPSGRINLYGPCWPRAMDQADVDRVVESFGQAVSLAREAGFDAVEIHAGHGYLISQFLSPYTNHRRDAYGGSFDRRARFLREVMAEVLRAAGGRIAVVVKTNLYDGFPGGMELDDGIAIAKLLERDGADGLVLSGGFVSRAPMVIMRGAMPMDVMKEGIADPLLRLGISLFGNWMVRPVPYRDTYFLEDAMKVRAEVRLPLIYVGGVTSRASIDGVLARGFEAVAMARALIHDPGFVGKLQRGSDAPLGCDHCNACAARIYTTTMECNKPSREMA